jgi:hypothetical protein
MDRSFSAQFPRVVHVTLLATMAVGISSLPALMLEHHANTARAATETVPAPVVGFTERWPSARTDVSCKQGTWPYFDNECLWATAQKRRHARVSPKQRHSKMVILPHPTKADPAEETETTTSAAVSLPVAAPRQTAAAPQKPQKVAQTSKGKQSPGRGPIQLSASVTSYAAVPAPWFPPSAPRWPR